MTKKNIIIIGSAILALAFVSGLTAQKTAGGGDISADIGVTCVDDSAGVRIENVELMGYAAGLGLEQGDIVLKINNKTVKGVDSFLKLISSINNNSGINIQILRYGVEMTVGQKAASGNGANGWYKREASPHT